MLGQTRQSGRTNNNIIDTGLLFDSFFANKDGVLDEEFTIEEMERTVHSFKNGKRSGADVAPQVWRTTLNGGLITPIFKGKERDLLDPNNYWVILVISKCFERALWHRCLPILEEQSFPRL